MVGCSNKEPIPNKSENMEKVWGAYTCEIDSCEYIKHGHGLAHKGNCRFCAERRKQEIKELMEEIRK